MANVGNVFYPSFTSVFFIFSTFFLRFYVFYFHLNVYYIYDLAECRTAADQYLKVHLASEFMNQE